MNTQTTNTLTKRKEHNELWDNFKEPSIHVIGFLNGDEREGGTEKND